MGLRLRLQTAGLCVVPPWNRVMGVGAENGMPEGKLRLTHQLLDVESKEPTIFQRSSLVSKCPRMRPLGSPPTQCPKADALGRPQPFPQGLLGASLESLRGPPLVL